MDATRGVNGGMVEIVKRLPLELRQRVYALLTRSDPNLPWGWLVLVARPDEVFCEVHENQAWHSWRAVDANELRSLLPAGWSGRPSRQAPGCWCYFHAATRTTSWAWPRSRHDWVLQDPAP